MCAFKPGLFVALEIYTFQKLFILKKELYPVMG